MVKVPVYEPSVQLRPEFRQDLAAQATPQAFGSDVGAGMENLAKGGMQAAHSMAAVRNFEDTLRAKDADNSYAGWMRERMYGEGGFMTLEGRAAIDGRAAFEREAEEKRKEFGQGLTPGAARHYDTASNSRLQSTLGQSIVHTAQARKTWFNEGSAARVKSFADDALVNYTRPDLVTKNIALGQAEIRQAGEMHGWDSATLKQREQEFISGVHKNITLRMAETDPVAADKYRKDNANSMTGADQFSLESALSSEVKIEQSKRNADEFLQRGRVSAAQPAARTAGQSGPTAARATLYAALPGGKGREHVDGLDEAFATNLGAMIQDAPPDIRKGLQIGSGFRSVERQRELWEASDKSGKMVAPPGRSFHNHGQAVDLWYNGQRLDKAPADVRQWVHQNAGAYGLYFPMGYEPWHVEPQGTRGGGGTVAPRTNTVAPRAAMASYDDLEGYLSGIKDTKVRDLTRQRIMTGIEMQNKAAEARQKQAAASLWTYIDKGQTPDQVPMDVRQAAGMSAVSSAWNYLSTVKNGREVQTDETLAYDMRRYQATNPEEFAKVDLNDYRGRLSKDVIKELTGLQTAALTDQRKAREEGLKLTQAYSQAETQLAAVGITTDGKKGSELEKANKRIAQFNNALSAQMDTFKRENNNRAPTQADIQTMINRLLLPVVIKQPGSLWGENTWTPPNATGGGLFGTPKTFAFDAAMRPEGATISANIKVGDIPLSLRKGIAADLERNLGRKPSEAEIVRRYEDVVLQRPVFDNWSNQ